MSQSGPSGPLDIGLGVEPPFQPGSPLAPSNRPSGRRGVLVGIGSVIVVFGLLGWIVVNSPNWPLVQDAFFNAKYFWRALPYVAQGFVVNIQLFLVSEVLVLICGLGIALMRTVPGPVFLPLRLLAVIYSDFFRGVPASSSSSCSASASPPWGSPACRTIRSPSASLTLVLLYTAYVARGLPGRHRVRPSQPGGRRPLAWPEPGPGAALRGRAAGGSAGHPARC